MNQASKAGMVNRKHQSGVETETETVATLPPGVLCFIRKVSFYANECCKCWQQPGLGPGRFPKPGDPGATVPILLCNTPAALQSQSAAAVQAGLIIKRKDCRMNLISGVKLISSYLLQCCSFTFPPLRFASIASNRMIPFFGISGIYMKFSFEK